MKIQNSKFKIQKHRVQGEIIRAIFWALTGLLIGTLLALLLVSPARAGENFIPALDMRQSHRWITGDTALQASYAVLWIMDWNQTLQIARNPQKYWETNSFLGRHPSEGRVNSYFALNLIGHTAVAYLLPRPYRTIWQSIYIGMELEAVNHNRKIGLGVSLHF